MKILCLHVKVFTSAHCAPVANPFGLWHMLACKASASHIAPHIQLLQQTLAETPAPAMHTMNSKDKHKGYTNAPPTPKATTAI
jgi:hypothetical protein